MHTDVENYLINSRHRTVDGKKMSCYRQFIRGYNFHKEGYVHNIMMNNISTENPLCYVRSKCFANKIIRSFSAYKIHRRTIDMYHKCDTSNFPFWERIRKLEYLIICCEKKHFFLISTKSHTYVPGPRSDRKRI
jgi:hypothetical protein